MKTDTTDSKIHPPIIIIQLINEPKILTFAYNSERRM